MRSFPSTDVTRCSKELYQALKNQILTYKSLSIQ